MKPLHINQLYFCLWFLSSFFAFLSFQPHFSHLFSQSTHSSSLFPPFSALFFCLISSCLTLLLLSPPLPFASTLSTSSLTLLWPFTPSSSFHSFIPDSPPVPDSFPLFFPSILSSPPLFPFILFLPLPFPPSSPPVLLCQLFSWCLTGHGVCIGKMPQNMACRQRHHWAWSGISYQMSLWPH